MPILAHYLFLIILRDLIRDTQPLIDEEKKPWCQVNSNSRLLDYEAVALTT